ncbi:MAG: LysM peptidoglycan-binding domain-containing protein [Candidatus Eisenbacteria bacterium]|nr:LysM peptidoglycan-binding domain-containing protein [Candidatus Eisenbacteria bacterium]
MLNREPPAENHVILSSPHRAALAAIVVAALALTGTPAKLQASPGVSAIRHWTAPDHTRVVVDLTEEARYSTRVLAEPDRIVVLVVGGVIAEAPRTTDVGDGLVERVRLNQLDSGVQVVVDLEKAAPHNVFPLKPYLTKPDRIVIDVLRSKAPTPTPVSRTIDNGPPKVVVIDPGHGGEDPGTLGNGELTEKDVVLDIARKLEKGLASRGGYEVYLTRKGDYFVPLAKRKLLAHEAEGDIFISIHANSAPNRNAAGSEVFFVSPRGASDQAARELADRENACDLVGGVSPDADSDILSVLVDLKMTDSVEKSSDLASFVMRHLRTTGTSVCVVKQAGFVVLKQLAMPSVLVEVGFLTNRDDVRRLKSADYRSRYASSLADAIDDYFDRYAPAEGVVEGEHRVAPGETLWSIARRYGLTVGELRELNGLAEDATIQVDQVLSVSSS